MRLNTPMSKMKSPKEGMWLKWIIFGVGFYVNTFVFAVIFAYGSFLTAILDKFQENLPATTAVQSIFTGVALSSGILSGILISRFGVRTVSFVGAVLLPMGFIVSFLAESVFHLYICISIVSGVGVSVLFISSTTCTGRIFGGSKRLVILALQNTGISIGVAVLPYIFDFSLKMYGLNGTFLLMGGFYLNCIPASRILAIYENTSGEHQNNGNQMVTEKLSTSESFIGVLKEEFKQLITNVKTVMDVPFTLSTIGIGFILGTLNGYFALVVDILTWKGFRSSQALLSFPITYGFGFIARLLPGLVELLRKVNSFVLPIVFGFCGLSGQLVIQNSTTFPVVLVGCGLSGLAISGITSSGNIIVVQLVKKEHIAIGLGLVYTTIGILSTVTGPAYGSIRDIMQSYTLVLYLTAGFQLVAVTLFIIIIVLRQKETRRKSHFPEGIDNYAISPTEDQVFHL